MFIEMVMTIDWNHIHLATNHIPIIGSMFCMIFWIFSWMRKDVSSMRMVLWVIVFTSVAGIAVKFTGEPAAENVEVVESVLKAHEDWADRATTGLFFWFLAGIWGLVQTRNNKPFGKICLGTITFFGLATMALLGAAAFYGGKINH